MTTCKSCNEELKGRSDKTFCDPYCKSAYHYKKAQEKEASMFQKIDKQLKLNRRLLKKFNVSGKSTVREEDLLKEGFNPSYFTHYWKNNKGAVYLFCYEFGFLKVKDNNRDKFSLVKWQSYMDK